jgi:hypothetical protein
MRNTILAVALAVASCEANEIDVPEMSNDDIVRDMFPATVDPKVSVPEPLTLHPREVSKSKAIEVQPPANPWVSVPNVCETFDVYEAVEKRKGRYPVNYKRNRYRLTYADRKQTYALARMVADEMGFEPLIPEIAASHEASGKAEAIHILNADRDANQQAWQRYSYSRNRERNLEAKLEELSVHDKKYWLAKRDLRNTRMYKGNPHWDTFLKYTYHMPERPPVPAEEWDETRSIWWFGYGLYGMNAVLYTHVWDNQAPPWIMCSHQGIVATIMYVWVARDAHYKCAELSQKNPEKYGYDGATNRGLLRRMAKGQCGKGRLGPQWKKLMKDFEKRGIDWDAAPRVGEKWPAYEMYSNGNPKRDENGDKIPTDRQAVLDHMIKKAKKKNLLRSDPLVRPEGTDPRLVVR